MNMQKAVDYARLKELKEAHETKAKSIGRMLDAMGKDICAMFLEDGLKNIRVSAVNERQEPLFHDGKDRILAPKIETKASVTQARLDEFHTWMRNNGFGDLIRESIHHQTLNKWVETRQKNGDSLPPDGMIHLFTVQGVKLTRAAAQ